MGGGQYLTPPEYLQRWKKLCEKHYSLAGYPVKNHCGLCPLLINGICYRVLGNNKPTDIDEAALGQLIMFLDEL